MNRTCIYCIKKRTEFCRGEYEIRGNEKPCFMSITDMLNENRALKRNRKEVLDMLQLYIVMNKLEHKDLVKLYNKLNEEI